MNPILSHVLVALLTALACGIVFAMCLSASRADETFPDPSHIEIDSEDTALLNWLDNSECGLLFNPQFNLWGITDAKNAPLAGGRTPREALSRARAKDRDVRLSAIRENRVVTEG